jgi:hypothetical protein
MVSSPGKAHIIIAGFLHTWKIPSISLLTCGVRDMKLRKANWKTMKPPQSRKTIK